MKNAYAIIILLLANISLYGITGRENIIARERVKCTLPEDLSIAVSYSRVPLKTPPQKPYQVYADFVAVAILFYNKGPASWNYDLKKSTVSCPAQAWQSGWVDNFSGRPPQEVIPINPGKTMLKLYPQALLRETDAEIHDIRWFDWPHGELQFFFSLKDSEGKSYECFVK
jgi:hypothetical protein